MKNVWSMLVQGTKIDVNLENWGRAHGKQLCMLRKVEVVLVHHPLAFYDAKSGLWL